MAAYLVEGIWTIGERTQNGYDVIQVEASTAGTGATGWPADDAGSAERLAEFFDRVIARLPEERRDAAIASALAAPVPDRPREK